MFFLRKYCKPRIAVDILLYDTSSSDNFYFLAVRRNTEPYRGYFVLPGGMVECNETVEEAAMRELKEESGINLKLSPEDQFRVYSQPNRDPRYHVITVVFAKQYPLKNKKIKYKGNKEIKEVKVLDYFNKKEVLGFDHEFIVRDFINSLMN